MHLPEPKLLPPLDPDFRPAALANRAFREEVAASGGGVPLVLTLERGGGAITRFETRVFPADSPRAVANLTYANRLLKTLLWARGGWRVCVGGPAEIGGFLKIEYSPRGQRAFDAEFMGSVYQRPFEIAVMTAEEAPAAQENTVALGRHLEGNRIGFDAGASDYKVAAVIEGESVFSEEYPWDPKVQSDPEYHYEHIMHALREAAKHMPRVDALGVSSAGIYIDNRVAVASLFRAIPADVFDAEVRDLFLRVQRDMGGIPMEVANDGDVAALAGAMSLDTNRLLGVAFGSSEAAGYVDTDGNITGWLNELAFVPFDFGPSAPADDWSGYPGVGAQYLCQTGVVRMAEAAGIELDASTHLAERLKVVQERMATGDERARQVYITVGRWVGYAIAYYAEFYDLAHVLLLGRVTTGEGGELLINEAREVLKQEFPELTGLELHLPGEKERRVGQAIAAASLPEIIG
ncbi:MAG TPA: ROK family protein [Armatimonadota bacterium]|jgi:predicted NBD/HSP70 family sugar kinase